MKKKILIGLFMITMCFALTGCLGPDKTYHEKVPVSDVYYDNFTGNINNVAEEALEQLLTDNEPLHIEEDGKFSIKLPSYSYNLNDDISITKGKVTNFVLEGYANSTGLYTKMTFDYVTTQDAERETKGSNYTIISKTNYEYKGSFTAYNGSALLKDGKLSITFPSITLNTTTTQVNQDTTTTNSGQERVGNPVTNTWKKETNDKNVYLIFKVK